MRTVYLQLYLDWIVAFIAFIQKGLSTSRDLGQEEPQHESDCEINDALSIKFAIKSH